MMASLILSDLFSKQLNNGGLANIIISGISADSRNVKPGDIFFALPGSNVNGTKFITDAISRGAKVVVTDIKDNFTSEIPSNIYHIKLDNIRKFLSIAAANFYQDQPDNIIAVTGTNGKSSVVHFCREIWKKLHHKAVSIGTLGVIGDINLDQFPISSSLTTPDIIFIHKLLAALVKEKVNYVALEASSHGLQQYRIDNIKLKAAGFTSFSRDHLDYHGTIENYFEAKSRLFSEVMESGNHAVLNSDITEFSVLRTIASKAGHCIIDYGKSANVIKLLSLKTDVNNQYFSFKFNNQIYDVTTSMIGDFQVYNILCALGLVISLGENIDNVVKVIDKLKPVPGRMEKVNIPAGNNQAIIVDYAHTPDALLNALSSLRPLCQGKLIALFGCGGNRDQGKRAEMGKIAANYADSIIITDDNPRFESDSKIRQDIMSGCPKAVEIAGREQAIEYAIKNMKAKDILLLAGKGHEKVQIIANQQIEFDDVEIAKNLAWKYLA
ncbi:UDP-N-acetylmuramoyl-L-alanyl-D-glutamate--2, 6-diaminopimelate ligase [Rickettsiales bacterium Ac37b]|nr:UDP-N-acetylmuramoyl-L-alanyl-D-glutamate--2, 6-diaminopimelate ligase [Rickettsiales bacterium Ac37b]